MRPAYQWRLAGDQWLAAHHYSLFVAISKAASSLAILWLVAKTGAIVTRSVRLARPSHRGNENALGNGGVSGNLGESRHH